VLLWPVSLGLSIAGSLGGLLTASLLLVVRDDVRIRVVPWLVSYAVGTLLGASLLGLVPQALATLAPATALGTLLAGILTFFILEKLVLWRHCHEDESCEVHRSTAVLVIVGDAVHTFVDGIVIAAAALVSLPLGATTALAVIAHEIPQEVGDFAILLSAGQSRRRAFLLNLASAGGGLLGATAMLLFGAAVPWVVPFVLAFAAGNFLYVAMADLIPNLHRGHLDRSSVRQVGLIALGILTITAL
jgi:zinc and cadmium transporter